MINLIPEEDKNSIRAARYNYIILIYSGILIIASLLLIGSMYGQSLVLGETKKSAQESIDVNDTQAGVYHETKKRVSLVTDQLKNLQDITANELKLSSVLQSLSSVMPSDTIVTSLDIPENGSTVSIAVSGKTSGGLISLQTSLRNSTAFKDVTFETVSESGGTVAGYPANTIISATLTRGGF